MLYIASLFLSVNESRITENDKEKTKQTKGIFRCSILRIYSLWAGL